MSDWPKWYEVNDKDKADYLLADLLTTLVDRDFDRFNQKTWEDEMEFHEYICSLVNAIRYTLEMKEDK